MMNTSVIAREIMRQMYEVPVLEQCEYCKSYNPISSSNCIRCGAPDWRKDTGYQVVGFFDDDTDLGYLNNHYDLACRSSSHIITGRLTYDNIGLIYNKLSDIHHEFGKRYYLIVPVILALPAKDIFTQIYHGPNNRISLANEMIQSVYVNDDVSFYSRFPNVSWLIAKRPPCDDYEISELVFSSGTTP